MNLITTLASNIARRWPGIDANDLEQEAALAKLRGRKPGNGQMQDYCWHERYFRSSRRSRSILKRHVPLTPRSGFIPDHGPSAIARVDAESLLERTTEKRRQVIVLRYIYGMTETEIAETLGTSIGCVRDLYFLGMKQLRKLVQCA